MIAADLRANIRSLLRRPLPAAFAVVVLGLGIGLTTTLFSIVDGALLAGLPFPDSDRLVALYRTTASVPHPFKVANLHDFTDWRQRQRGFEDLAAYQASFAFLSTGSGTEGHVAAYVTPNLFEMLRVRPSTGRGFAPDEGRAGGPLSAIISQDLWQSQFGGDPGILGREVRVNRAVATIVGVMPEGFGFPYRQDLWLPLQMEPEQFSREQSPPVFVVGRLGPGTSIQAARAEMKQISGDLAQEHPATNREVEATVESFTDAFTEGRLRSSLLMMLAGVFGVLLIACTSVANLLLARTVRRRGELALRAALGAGRRRLFLQLLIETLLLTAAAAVLGVALAYLGIDLFNRFTETGDYLRAFWIDVELDATALGFVLVLAGLCTLAAGLGPAFMAIGGGASELLADTSRGMTRRLGGVSRSLVVVEVALSVGLLVAAGLTIKTAAGLIRLDYGFEKDALLLARLSLYPAEYPDDATKADALRRVEERLESTRALSVALASAPPSETPPPRELVLEGQPAGGAGPPTALPVVASPSFFDTFGIRILRGRGLQAGGDTETNPTAVVSRSFALRYLQTDDPIGYRFRWAETPDAPWIRIAGVAEDAIFGVLGEEAHQPVVYESLSPPIPTSVYLIVRSPHGVPLPGLADAVRSAVNEIDPRIAVYEVQSLARLLARESWLHRVFAVLFGILGVTALLLTVLGLYGVISFNAQARTHEFGIRSALGAERRSLHLLALREGLFQLGLGLALGLLLAYWITRSLSSALPGLEADGLSIPLLVVSVLTATGLLACHLPARRAAKVDPTTLLKQI